MSTIALVIPIPQNILSQIQRLCYGLPSAQWENPENFHLSLFSLTDSNGNTLLDVIEKIADFRFPPFEITLKDVSYYPNSHAKGLISLGIAPSLELNKLIKTLSQTLKEIPQTKFLQSPPQIVLAHYEIGDPLKLGDYLNSFHNYTSPPFLVDTLCIMKSHKTNKNRQIYFEEARCSLLKGLILAKKSS